MIGQIGEGGFERGSRRIIIRPVIDLLAAHSGETVIAAAVELDLIEPFSEQRDERQKTVALQPVLVEPIRRAVRGRHDHGAGLE